MDMRDKLFPIFIKETEKNLKILQEFLQAGTVSRNDPTQLEAAFRAAHTLKGTARLVEVDSVHQIGRRIEALLEKHLTAKSRPTAVEREALELAVGWLTHLLVDLQAGRPGSSSLVADALAALDLAARFPGDTPLVELLDSAVQQRAPQLSDPFSADPELELDEEEILRTAKDPFADDPSFGFGFNLLPDPIEQLSKRTRPARAENYEPVADSVEPAADDNLLPEAEESGRAEVPFDPFGEDSSFLEADEFFPEVEAESYNASAPAGDLPAEELVATTEPESVIAGTDKASAVLPNDPFADDDYLVDEFDKSAPAESEVVAAEERSTERVNEIADWLLLPDGAATAEHHYVCCCFALSGRNYYLPIDYVLEIAELPPLLPLPLAPAPVSGLVNLRGLVLPVVDLSSLDDHPQVSAAVQRLVVVEHRREKLAFLADGIPYLSETLVGEKIDLPEFIQSHTLKGAEE